MIVNIKGGLRLPKIFGNTPAGKAKLQRCIDFVRDEVVKTIASGTKTFNAQTLFGGDRLMALGLASGWMKLTIEDRAMWKILPGSVPYVYRLDNRADISSMITTVGALTKK